MGLVATTALALDEDDEGLLPPWAVFVGDDPTAAAEEEDVDVDVDDVFALLLVPLGVDTAFVEALDVAFAAGVMVPPRFFAGGDPWSSLKSSTSSTGLLETPMTENCDAAAADGNAADDDGNDGNKADRSRRGRLAMGSSSSDEEDDEEEASRTICDGAGRALSISSSSSSSTTVRRVRVTAAGFVCDGGDEAAVALRVVAFDCVADDTRLCERVDDVTGASTSLPLSASLSSAVPWRRRLPLDDDDDDVGAGPGGDKSDTTSSSTWWCVASRFFFTAERSGLVSSRRITAAAAASPLVIDVRDSFLDPFVVVEVAFLLSLVVAAGIARFFSRLALSPSAAATFSSSSSELVSKSNRFFNGRPADAAAAAAALRAVFFFERSLRAERF